MKIAVNALNFGPGATAENLRGWARFAEDTGFHALMISDHVTVTPDVAGQYPAPFFDPFSTLAWLAGVTERIELGTSVAILPYRSPLQTARVVANIDQFSGGRMILGAGVGWAKQEFDALGVAFERRGAITDEYLTAIRRHWAKETASMDGEFASFTDVSTEPLPVRTPPVWVGGASRAANPSHGPARHGVASDQRPSRLAARAGPTGAARGSPGTWSPAAGLRPASAVRHYGKPARRPGTLALPGNPGPDPRRSAGVRPPRRRVHGAGHLPRHAGPARRAKARLARARTARGPRSRPGRPDRTLSRSSLLGARL